MNPKSNRGGTTIFLEYYFAQIPTELIRCSEISRGARLTYGVYHSYAQEKRLMEKPRTFVSQKTLARDLGCVVSTVSKWTKELKAEGWIKIFRRGWKSSVIILHAKAKKVKKT